MRADEDQLAKLFSHVDENRDAFLGRLVDYLRHPSISIGGQGIEEVAALLVERLKGLGFAAETHATGNHPVVLGRRVVSPDKPTILFYGHYDVLPPDPLELWTSPPFEPEIRDGRIYARGVGDNKGQHFAQLLAIETHLSVFGELPCNVMVLLEGEEEIGSPNLAAFAETHSELLKADVVIISDGSQHESGQAVVTFGARGIAGFELRVRTANRDVHSGNFGGVVPNAVWKLVHLLSTMKSPSGEILIEGLSDRTRPPTRDECEAAAKLPLDIDELKSDLGISELDAPGDREYYDRLMFHPTFTINGLHGGYGGEGTKTIIPCEAVAKCDIRLVEPLTPEYIFEKIASHIERHAPDVEIIPVFGVPPSRTPLESPFTKPILDAIAHVRGSDPLLYPSMGGSLPNYVFTQILGIPAFVVPYANADQANHAPNENLEIERFLDGIKSGCAMLSGIGGMESF